MDKVSIPKNSLDVLAQILVGMSLEGRWEVKTAFDVLRQSYSYSTLSWDDYYNTLTYLAGSPELDKWSIYPKIWWNKADNTFTAKKGIRIIYFLNSGTIPEETMYKVFSVDGMPIGTLSERFVENLRSGDIFVLGGRSYEFKHSSGLKVFVADAHGRKPTLPSWSGELMARSWDLCIEVGTFRRELADRIAKKPIKEVLSWLQSEYFMDEVSALSLVDYFKQQSRFTPVIPSDKSIVIEGFIDGDGNSNAIVHSIFGLGVNKALARLLAVKFEKELGMTIRHRSSDDGFMLTSVGRLPLERIGEVLRSITMDECRALLL
ncbi:MAG: ATP-dependent helicase, partial [Thermoplasmata archaeon]